MKIRRSLLPWLVVAGAAELALACVQWFELESLRRGGGTTFCDINSTISCQTVWNSPMAVAVSEALRVPVAGLGVVWGLVAAFLGLMTWSRARTGASVGGALAGVRLAALAGVISVVFFVSGSIQAGALCLTCLGTYVLVGAYAALAWFAAEPRAPSQKDLSTGLSWSVVATAAVFLVVWFQARALSGGRASEPRDQIARLAALVPPERVQSRPDEALATVLQQLSPDEQKFISFARKLYETTPPPGVAQAPRQRWGPSDAPLRIVEWSDIRCPHCRDLLSALETIKRALPPGRLSVESRQYPLDKECNRALQGSDKTGLRCLGARAQICLEGAPDYDELVKKLFAAQDDLTQKMILDIAGSGSVSRADVERCVSSPETERKLQEDIAYAEAFEPRGTPVILMNGKYIPYPSPVFIYVMAIAGGRADSPAFASLPPPPAPRQ